MIVSCLLDEQDCVLMKDRQEEHIESKIRRERDTRVGASYLQFLPFCRTTLYCVIMVGVIAPTYILLTPILFSSSASNPRMQREP